MYGSESWNPRKSEETRLDAFEMFSWQGFSIFRQYEMVARPQPLGYKSYYLISNYFRNSVKDSTSTALPLNS